MSEYTYEDAKQVKQAPSVNYRKVEEQTATSYEEAQAKADALFAPYGEKDAQGSRTAADAKVRVRLRRGTNGRPDSFRVVLYKHVSTFKTQEEKKTDAKAEGKAKKKKPRHRNDRKGKKGNSSERKAAASG